MFVRTTDAELLVHAFGSGPKILVTHGGWVGSGELWLPVVERLPSTWKTVIYDHRGTGATINRSPSITFDQLVDDLFVVLDTLQIDTWRANRLARWLFWKQPFANRNASRASFWLERASAAIRRRKVNASCRDAERISSLL